MTQIKLLQGDCLDKLKELEDNSVDSVVTDPPYGIAFMNKEWDNPKKLQEQQKKDKKLAIKRGKIPASFSPFPGQGWKGKKEAVWFQEWTEDWARECMRVLKPGGHLISFCAPRMYHRMTVGIEDAGFEIRDQLMWVFGSGFPKSHNVGNSIDKLNGAGNRGHAISSGNRFHPTTGKPRPNGEKLDKYEARTQEGKGWEGWGTALKPAHEPIVMARKPLSEKTVARNVLEWGTGGINIDGCRIGYEDTPNPATNPKYRKEQNYKMPEKGQESKGAVSFTSSNNEVNTQGRFPANFIIECTCENPIEGDKGEIKYSSGSRDSVNLTHEWGYKDIQRTNYTDTGVIHTDPNCPCRILDEQSGNIKGGKPMPPFQGKPKNDINFTSGVKEINRIGYNDSGGASRFFYCPKAQKKDRNEGLEHLEKKQNIFNGKSDKPSKDMKGVEKKFTTQPKSNFHPTVKPTDLMTYLVRLVTPKGGLVLDPFMGSGSTGKAAVREGFDFIGIEREDEYMEIAKTRIEHEQSKHNYRNFWE